MGERTENVVDSDIGEVLVALGEIVRARRSADPGLSYTASLLTDAPERLYKKVLEESLEVVLAAKDDDHDHIRYELADLAYHVVVLMEMKQITVEELAGELKARML